MTTTLAMANKAKHTDNTKRWSPDSWQALPVKQQPVYEKEDQPALNSALEKLRSVPALVTPSEINRLKRQLAKVAMGNGFLLQGGDCAESFKEFNETNLRSYLQVMLQMTVALMYGTGQPVVKVGRIAGQFAKPRSAPTETVDDQELPSYRGDIINDVEFNEDARRNNPDNLLKAYEQASATLNFLRSLTKGGEASLRNISRWNEAFISESKQGKRFADIVNRIDECVSFIEACGLNLESTEELKQADFYSSHEGLLLPYEEALVRFDEKSEKYYACSAHMLWIGDRTRALDEALRLHSPGAAAARERV